MTTRPHRSNPCKALVLGVARTDRFHLTAAEGWLGLGNWFDANAELEKISPRMRDHPGVLHARYGVFALAGDWLGAVGIAGTICELLPNRPSGYVKWARALHELKRTKEARDVLRLVADSFDDEPDLPYEVARYCCQLGEWAEAIRWLKRAIDLHSGIRQIALDDQDLQPLRAQIGKI